MARRASLVLLVVGAGVVLVALRSAVAYDFGRYTVISGFEASRWTWLLVVGAALLALRGLVVRRSGLARPALASAIAATCVSIAIAWTVRTTPHRVEPARTVIDCSNQNIGIGCRLHELLDSLEPGPPDAAPSRALLFAALGAYALIGTTSWIRHRTDR